MDLDWRINKTQSQRLRYMFENEIDSNVTFKVGEDQETIKAHKFILTMQSPVFEKMFNGSYCESEKGPVIPDITPATFRALLRYCYYECLEIDSAIALPILYAAKKYMLIHLEEAARKYLIDNLDESDMLELGKYAFNTGDDELLAGCRNYIALKLDEVNVHDIYKYAADTGDEVLHEISRDMLARNIDVSNVWEVYKCAADTRDNHLHASCNTYVAKNLDALNVWQLYIYATDIGDEKLHASCHDYLEKNLNRSDMWKVYKYAKYAGDDKLHQSCLRFLARNLKRSNIWEVCRKATNVEDDTLHKICWMYLVENIETLNISKIRRYATSIGDMELHSICNKYLGEKLNASNIWQIWIYANDIEDEELFASCHRYLRKNLNTSNALDICKYAKDAGVDDIEDICREYLVGNLDSSNVLQAYKFAIDIKDEILRVCCSSFILENVKMSEKSSSYVLHVTKLACCARDDKLISYCKAFLKSHPTDIWEIYKPAIDAGDQEVLSLCRQYFEGDVRAVREALQTEAFLNIPYEVLLDFLHINDKAVHVDEYQEQETNTDMSINKNCISINISEIELFKACNAWAWTECRRQKIESTSANKRALLGECLHLIRFSTMAQKDLRIVVYPTGLLTQVELAQLGCILPVNGRPYVKPVKQIHKRQVKPQHHGQHEKLKQKVR